MCRHLCVQAINKTDVTVNTKRFRHFSKCLFVNLTQIAKLTGQKLNIDPIRIVLIQYQYQHWY